MMMILLYFLTWLSLINSKQIIGNQFSTVDDIISFLNHGEVKLDSIFHNPKAVGVEDDIVNTSSESSYLAPDDLLSGGSEDTYTAKNLGLALSEEDLERAKFAANLIGKLSGEQLSKLRHVFSIRKRTSIDDDDEASSKQELPRRFDSSSDDARFRREAYPDPEPEPEPSGTRYSYWNTRSVTPRSQDSHNFRRREAQPIPDSNADSKAISMSTENPGSIPLDGFYRNHPYTLYGRKKRSPSSELNLKFRFRKGGGQRRIGRGRNQRRRRRPGMRGQNRRHRTKLIPAQRRGKDVMTVTLSYGKGKEHRGRYRRSLKGKTLDSNEKEPTNISHERAHKDRRKRHVGSLLKMIGLMAEPKEESEMLYMSAEVDGKVHEAGSLQKVWPKKLPSLVLGEPVPKENIITEPLEPTIYKPTDSYKNAMNKAKLVRVY